MTSETAEITKTNSETFKKVSISWARKAARRLRDPVDRNIYRFRFNSENMELVGMPKILSRVYFETVPVFLQRCGEFCIKIRVVPESQTFLLIIETVEVPKNLLKAWTVTEKLWHSNQIL
jgi:hypothetical protein